MRWIVMRLLRGVIARHERGPCCSASCYETGTGLGWTATAVDENRGHDGRACWEAFRKRG